MSDRKALLHYYPPDFDPSKIPRRKQPKDQQQVVRLMAPFSMRCNTCGEYVYKGKKFNARKELVVGQDYYGIKIFRFYIKCPQCSAEITFKTDPKNTDYAAEHGASRNFEPWRPDNGEEEGEEGGEKLTAEQEEEEYLARKLQEKEGSQVDPMKQLEQRTLDARREMEILDALQDIRTRNARLERVSTDQVLAALDKGKGKQTQLEEEIIIHQQQLEQDEKLVQKYFAKIDDKIVKRKVQDQDLDSDPNDSLDEPQVHQILSEATKQQLAAITASSSSSTTNLDSSLSITIASSTLTTNKKKKKNTPNAFGLVKKKKKIA